MAYEKTNWVNDETPLNAENMNKIEQGIADSCSQEDFNKVVNNETQIKDPDYKNNLAIGGAKIESSTGTRGNNNIAIGKNCKAYQGQGNIVIGYQAEAGMNTYGGGNYYSGIAMGDGAESQNNNAFQLGRGKNTKQKSLQLWDDNIYDGTTHTLTVQNIELNGKDLKSHALENLTLTGDAVLTSTETFTTHTQILVEFETDGIHAGFDCILHPYDEAICMVTYDVLTNGTPHFGTCYLDDTGHVVINVPTGMTFTNVKAHYIVLE